MDSPKPQPGLLVIVGAALALAAGAVIAWMLLAGGRGERAAPPPASQAGLVIESAGEDVSRIDPARPLRCFVEGQYVGELTLAACAQRNGVATGALDVGVDETGALAAAQPADVLLTPLPPVDEAAGETPVESALPPEAFEAEIAPVVRGAQACWRHGQGQWRKVAPELGLNACVQVLFAGRCEAPGAASYGRWGQQTLRLVPGRVEISSDNQTFRTLVSQAPNCAIPPVA